MTLSIWKQTQQMRKEWPRFEVLRRNRFLVLWEGPLRPLCQSYTVRVLLHRNQKRSRANSLRTSPEVVVINPLLRQRSEDPSDPIPHHYPYPSLPELPILCLYDPATKQWHPRLAVARTIIPWTIDWLVCYEGWLATGEWTGGGRHG